MYQEPDGRVELDAYMDLNFVKEVQLIVEHVILAVFAAVVKRRRSLTKRTWMYNIRQSPNMYCWDCRNTLSHSESNHLI